MGFLIGVFTLIYVVWRVVENIPRMFDSYYKYKQDWFINWAKRKEEQKKIKGRKRHIAVDILGLLLVVVIHTAGIQERAGAKLVMMNLMAC